MNKLWGGVGLDPFIDRFLSSLSVDKRLLLHDIKGSLAHVAMLQAQGIVTKAVAKKITVALQQLSANPSFQKIKQNSNCEDIHSYIENTLTKQLGDAGRSVHAGRSRNDQVALDLRLWLRDYAILIQSRILNVIKIITTLAKAHTKTFMPGYTHLQRAQVISFGYHLLAWAAALKRDYQRLADCRVRMDECPLGSAALAGSGLPLDRYAVALQLGFSDVSRNGIDAVGERDVSIEFVSATALIQMHLSRYCEEIILWSSSEFDFISIGKSCSTGSSIMPQKRNPDTAELIRGKTGRSFGSLIGLLVLQKGLPLAYNRDLQEDKYHIFDAVDTCLDSLNAFALLLSSITVKAKNMRRAAESGYLWAADAADFLVLKGIPFRCAYKAAKALVLALEKCTDEHTCNSPIKLLQKLGQAGLESLSKYWANIKIHQLAEYLDVEACLLRRNKTGGTAPKAVLSEIVTLTTFIKVQDAKLSSTKAKLPKKQGSAKTK